MFTSILLAILISAAPVDDTSLSSVPLNVSIGNMSFTGDAIRLTKSENGAFECAIDGESRVSIGSDGDTDISIAAQNIIISRDGNSEVSIRCTGDCRFSDAEHSCRADRIQIHFKTEFTLQLSGACRVQYGSGDDRTVLAAETITFDDGTFWASGSSASVQRTP